MTKKELIFATGNRGKIDDVRRYFASSDIEILSPTDAMERHSLTPPPEDVEETGDTYEANALIKAEALYEWSNLPTFGDDSGLEVAALNGEPGLYSARYAGPGCTFDDNIKKLLVAMEGESNRAAKFICVISYIDQGGEPKYFRGELNGKIVTERRGTAGFGYDPIFLVEDTGKTLAELKADASAPLESHRTRALTLFQQAICS